MSKLYMIRCPKCGKENYAIAVATGICVWCLYEAKESDIGGGVFKGRDKSEDK